MATLDPSVSPVVVDVQGGQPDGKSTITYAKDKSDELWWRSAGQPWDRPNLFSVVGTPDAETQGSYEVTLRPGEWHEVGIYREGNGPDSADVVSLKTLVVYCFVKKPEGQPLITDETRSTGGTWHEHMVYTTVPTNVVAVGCSRFPPTIDADGVPHLVSPDGGPKKTPQLDQYHLTEIRGLHGGNDYHCLILVVDEFGNWDFRQETFTTLRRQLTVQFETVHVYNDGDPSAYGEAEFYFDVYRGPMDAPDQIEGFHLPVQDIDDWGETDRPYPVGFAHVGVLERVDPDRSNVSVSTKGYEHDEPESPESAWGDEALYLPTGKGIEKITNSTFRMDAVVVTTGDDFRYGVDVTYSVEYDV